MSLQKFALGCVIGAFSLLVHMSAYAQTRSLEELMGLMGRSFGGIARPVNAGTAGPVEAQLARDVLALTIEAQGVLPTSVTSLPEAEQAVRGQRPHGLPPLPCTPVGGEGMRGGLVRAYRELRGAQEPPSTCRARATAQQAPETHEQTRHARAEIRHISWVG